MAIAAGAVLLALAAWFAGPALIVRVEVDDPDAIVMLASHEWERLPAAAALARRYPRSQLLLTLPMVPSPANCQRCSDRPAWLKAEGVPAGQIVQLAWRTRNTYDEAQAVAHYADQRRLERVLVVTSPYHTRRAVAVFSHALAGRHIAVGVVPAGSGGPRRAWWAAADDRQYVVYEWAANLVYWFRYRIPPWPVARNTT